MFARVKKNTGTLRKSIIACHNIKVGDKVKQITAKCFGHSSDQAEQERLLDEAKLWITEHGSEWLQNTLPNIKRNSLSKAKESEAAPV